MNEVAEGCVRCPGNREHGVASGTRANFVECECASGPEDTSSFLERHLLGLDVHQRVLEPDDIERLVLERQVEGVPVPKANLVGQPHSVGKQRRCPAILLDHIDSDDITIELGSEGTGGPTDTTTDIEDAIAIPDSSDFGDFTGCITPANVELVERCDIVPGERVDVLSGGVERVEDLVVEVRHPVMIVQCRLVAAVRLRLIERHAIPSVGRHWCGGPPLNGPSTVSNWLPSLVPVHDFGRLRIKSN